MTKETYQRSVDILLDAYNNGTLFHGNCAKCAVGNLLETDLWRKHFYTNRIGEQFFDDYGFIGPEHWKKLNERLYSLYTKKGYTRKELEKIEHAFEMSIVCDRTYYIVINPKKGQYLGLCAVLKVMAEMVEDNIPKKEVKQNQEKLDTIATEKFNVLITA